MGPGREGEQERRKGKREKMERERRGGVEVKERKKERKNWKDPSFSVASAAPPQPPGSPRDSDLENREDLLVLHLLLLPLRQREREDPLLPVVKKRWEGG